MSSLRFKLKRPVVLFDSIFLILLLTVYFFFGLDHLPQQGIYCDVGLLGNKAMGIYKHVHFEGADFITVLGRSFPLMLLDYHGPVEIYMFLPALYLLGNTALALHIVPVIFGGLVLPLFYAFLLLVYKSRLLGISLSLLLATLPSFIAANRVGFYTGTLLMFFGIASTLCFLLWIRKGRFAWLAAAFLLLGLGIGSRCFFWWFPIGLLIFSALFYREPLLRIHTLGLREKIACLFALGLGPSPIVLFNLLSKGYTFRFLVNHTVVSNDGISNLNYISNLKERIAELIRILRGNVYTYSLSDNRFNMYIIIASLTILLCGVVYVRFVKKKTIPRPVLFPVAISLLVLLQSPLTISGMSALHILYILPFVLMIIAAAVSMSDNRNLKTVLAIALTIATGFSLVTNFSALHSREAHLCVHGGPGTRWNVALDVVKWLEGNNIKKIGLGDTGISDAVLYLSGYQLEAEEIFYTDLFKRLGVLRETKEGALRQRLRNQTEGYYLFRPTQSAWIPYFERFSQIAQEEHKKVTVAREFMTPASERETVFILYRVTDFPEG